MLEVDWQEDKENALPFANLAYNARYPALYEIFYRCLEVRRGYLRDAV